MKTSESDRNDEALDRVLRRWEVKAVLPPAFGSEVWRRIDRAQKPRGLAARAWLTSLFESALVKPSVAAAYLMTLLIAGSVFGWSQAQRDKGQTNELLGQRYVRLIDPYQRLR
ncbi:MAG: hypothetical protein HYY23_21560 [Verrucomicrobia bacterium]|nr:hypothetical protein [Verrucomicrobiota bacterium]